MSATDGVTHLLAITATEWAAVALLAGAAVAFSVPGIRAYMTKRRNGEPAPSSVGERSERFARLARERQELESLMSDVRELTRLCAAQIDARTAKLEQLLERAERAAARLDGAPASPSVETRRVTVAPAAPRDPHAERIFALADAGKSPVEIASELGEHVGKIELMLALRA